MSDKKFMQEALKEAEKAYNKNEVPVGAVAVFDGKIIARAHNERESLADPTAHAELSCIKEAAKKLGRWRLNGLSLYSTLEPCAMCAGALVHARIDRLVYGAHDEKAGACGSTINIIDHKYFNHKVKVDFGVLEKECGKLLKDFFKNLRED